MSGKWICRGRLFFHQHSMPPGRNKLHVSPTLSLTLSLTLTLHISLTFTSTFHLMLTFRRK